MKIKADFITNSSSTMYIIEFNKEFLRKNFEEFFTLRTGEYFRSFNDMSSLVKYTQDKDVDWITEVTKHPIEYWGMGEDEFKEATRIIEEGNHAVYLVADRNDYDRTERMENIILENGGLIRLVGSD